MFIASVRNIMMNGVEISVMIILLFCHLVKGDNVDPNSIKRRAKGCGVRREQQYGYRSGRSSSFSICCHPFINIVSTLQTTG